MRDFKVETEVKLSNMEKEIQNVENEKRRLDDKLMQAQRCVVVWCISQYFDVLAWHQTVDFSAPST